MPEDVIYFMAASKEEWAAFDAEHPNQDADSGAPFRRRYPRLNVPAVQVDDADGYLETRAYSCELVQGDPQPGIPGVPLVPAIARESVAARGYTQRSEG